MDGTPYLILCTSEGCQAPAQYKIAAVWNDGTTQELKTYALSCECHLEVQLRHSRDKQRTCRLADGETLSAPQIFRIESGRRDRELVRMPELETKFQEELKR
jgi:hypothetical protein